MGPAEEQVLGFTCVALLYATAMGNCILHIPANCDTVE